MKNLNKEILAEALRNDICAPWATKIENAESVEELLQMYVDGIDFCLSNNFPSNGFLQETAGVLLQKYGIRIDEIVEVINPEKLVLLGTCSAKVSVTGYAVSQLFIKHNSVATVFANSNAFVMIDVFDDANLTVIASDESKLIVNVYGNAKVIEGATENAYIKVVRKLKDTY